MAAKHSQDFKIGASIPQILNVIRSKFFLENLRLEPCGEKDIPHGLVCEFHCKMTFTSYGEHLTVTITSITPTTTALTILSKCSVPTQVVDWGKNKQNVNNFVNALVKQLNAMPPQQAAAPVQPKPQPTVARFCPECGAPTKEGAKFCAKCGSKIE